MHLLVRSLHMFVLLTTVLVLTQSANADSTASIALTLNPNVYFATAGSEITLSGFFTTTSPQTFNHDAELLFGLDAASPHLGILAGTVLSSLDFSPPSNGVFFQDVFVNGGFLGPTTIVGPTVTTISALRTFRIPANTPPGVYHYSYGADFDLCPCFFDQSLTVHVVPGCS